MTQYEIPMNHSSEAFERCWFAAGKHLVSQVDAGTLKFLRSNLTPPILEHLSFIFGNQIYFIHVRPLSMEVRPPSPLRSTFVAAEKANGVPCILEMKQGPDEAWVPTKPGWGLQHAKTKLTVNPERLVSDADIEISDWELQDFCVQVVRSKIEEDGGSILSWNSNPDVTPSLFFVDQNEKQHFVIVCAARYPESPSAPNNINDIKASVSSVTDSGYIARVSVASAEDPYDQNAATNGNFLPLYRSHPYHIKYEGLSALAE